MSVRSYVSVLDMYPKFLIPLGVKHKYDVQAVVCVTDDVHFANSFIMCRVSFVA